MRLLEKRTEVENFLSFSFFPFFEEQRAPRERAPSSELRLEGKGVKRTCETVVPFCEVEENFRQGRLKKIEGEMVISNGLTRF